MSENSSGPQRVAYFDVLRILATFAVVALHLSAQHWADTDVSSNAWQAFNLYDSAVRWAVPVFVMISGALFLSGTQSIGHILKKNVARIIAAFAFWSALYALYMAKVNDCPPDIALQQFFNGHYHMWFLFMIVGLYLLVPLLRPIVRDEALLRWFLLVTLLFSFLFPQIAAYLSLFSWEESAKFKALVGNFYYHFTLGFTPYFVLGYYMSRKEFSRRAEHIIYALGVLGFVLTIVMTSFASRRIDTATELFYGYDTFNVLFVCLAVFLFARNHLNFPKLGEAGHARIRALSRWSFGAYLVHPMFIEALDHFWGFNTLSLNVFLSVPLLTLLIGTAAFLVSALLHHVPFVRKYFV